MIDQTKSFSMLYHFFPNYKTVERLAAYACIDGIPAYLERFDPNQDVKTNSEPPVLPYGYVPQ